MGRTFHTLLGVDLGGGKGKSTAVALLKVRTSHVEIVEARTTSPLGAPFYDNELVDYIRGHHEGAVLAMDAPLTLPACVRCPLETCPGEEACTDPTISWLREQGKILIERDMDSDPNRIAPIRPNTIRHKKPLITPYTQRATEVVLNRVYGISSREALGQGNGPVSARAARLLRSLHPLGFRLHENLIETYPKATLHQLFGARLAHRYRRHPDTWQVRATILESWSPFLQFAPKSGLAKELVLGNDHCFDAVVCALTAYLWMKEGWSAPSEDSHFRSDGWIYAPGVSIDHVNSVIERWKDGRESLPRALPNQRGLKTKDTQNR